MEAFPKLTRRTVCKTTRELAESQKTAQFLDAYNARKRRRNGNWEDVTVERLKGDYNLSKQVIDEVMNGMPIPGGTRLGITSQVTRVLDQHLEEVKSIDLERVLPETEVIERFSAMDINIVELMARSEEYYLSIGYDEALRRVGVLGEDEEYSLPMPKFTELDMQMLEEVSGSSKEYFIDDSRLTDAETLRHIVYKGEALPKHLSMVEHALPLDEDDLMIVAQEYPGLESEKDVKSLFASLRENAGDPERAVRLLAFHKPNLNISSLMGMQTNNCLASVSGSDVEFGCLPLSLGSVLRYKEYCKLYDEDTYERFDRIYSVDAREMTQSSCDTVLNNVLPSGMTLVMVESENSGKKPKFKKVNPGVRDSGESYKEAYVFG